MMVHHPVPTGGRSYRKGSTRRRSRAEIETLLLDLLIKANGPLSAYTLADRASAAGHRTVPNQVYRTLSRLIDDGRVHRIESISAFMLKRDETDICLICDHCHAVRTLAAAKLRSQLFGYARTLNFAGRRAVIEIHGRCADCSASDE